MGVCSNGVLYVFLRFFEGAWILTLQAGGTDPPGSPRIPPGSPSGSPLLTGLAGATHGL